MDGLHSIFGPEFSMTHYEMILWTVSFKSYNAPWVPLGDTGLRLHNLIVIVSFSCSEKAFSHDCVIRPQIKWIFY